MRIRSSRWCLGASFAALAIACSNTHLIFTTYTKTGLDISLSNEIPTEVVFGYKRFEGAIVPVDASVEQLRQRAEALSQAIAETSERAANAKDPSIQAAAGQMERELAEELRAALASLQLLESAYGFVASARESASAAQDDLTAALGGAGGEETAEVKSARDRLAAATERFVQAQKALDRAFQSVSDMAPVLAANRIENSWTRGMVICQIFATGDATDTLLASADQPLEELAACTGRGAR